MTVAINFPYNSDLFYVKKQDLSDENSLKPIKAGWVHFFMYYYEIAKFA